MNVYWDKINELISQLSEEAAALIHKQSIPGKFRKGEHLVTAGSISRKSYLLVEGIARKYYLNDGKDITTEFFFPGDLAISLCSYSLNQPSKLYIQAITDVDVVQTDYETFQKAKCLYPELHEFDVKVTEYYAMWLEERLFQFHTQSATTRYSNLLASNPDIVKHIPLTHIASFLGVSLETLSRIRAKI